MNTLLDTNILTRAAQPSHPMNTTAVDAVDALRRRGDKLFIVPHTHARWFCPISREEIASIL